MGTITIPKRIKLKGSFLFFSISIFPHLFNTYRKSLYHKAHEYKDQVTRQRK